MAECIADQGLELAHAKLEAVVLTKKWAYRQPRLFSGGVQILVMRAVKYVGDTLDSKLSFTRHIRAVSASAVALARAVGRLMLNVGGPLAATRRLLVSVVSSRPLYATPVWAFRARKYEINKTVLGRAQQLAALRITRCYLMVSTTVALFLAEIPPANLLATEREAVRKRKREEANGNATADTDGTRDTTLVEWQMRWASESSVAGWTRRVLSSVHKWIGRPLVPPYRLAQALTGYGAYNEYLHRFGIATSLAVLIVVPLSMTRSTRSFTAGPGMARRRKSRRRWAVGSDQVMSRNSSVGAARRIRKLFGAGGSFST